jgi:DNA-binding transcriptional ArsR family regulator
LLPGIAEIRPQIKGRYAQLWNDNVPGCPEIVLTADEGGCLADQDLRRLMMWLSTAPKGLSTTTRQPQKIRKRLRRLRDDVTFRRAYRDLLAEVWEVARPMWERRGRSVAARAAIDWTGRVASVTSWPGIVGLMPPRHPLTRYEQSEAVYRRREFSLAPLYFCMSGGDVCDLGHAVHIAVPASALDPVRRKRDASYVASQMRLIAEPTRVRILIHLLSTDAGVMEIARALKLSQPTVSEHVRRLARGGLIRRAGSGNRRAAYVASGRRVERIIEDARSTLSRWRSPEARRD